MPSATKTFWDFTPLLAPEITPQVQAVIDYVTHCSSLLVGKKVTVEVINEPAGGQYADYNAGGRIMRLNIGTLGKRWFQITSFNKLRALDDLMVHELGHQIESNHLSKAYNDALTLLGSRLTMLVRQGKADYTTYFPKVK